MPFLSPTGEQILLHRGSVTAQLAEVGALLRALTVDGTDLIAPFPADAPAPSCSGTVLAPWPNRIRDGKWNDNGTDRQLAITEPDKNNAIHGLLRYTAYTVEASESAATLSALVAPQLGYPYQLATSVTYTLTDAGITVHHRLTNHSDAAAPVALGVHPFVTLGGVDPNELVLRVPAATQYDVDERLLPVGTSPAPAALRDGIRLADADYDTGFADLTRDADGLVRHTLTAPDGRVVTLWQDAAFDYVQVYTTSRYPGHARAVAIEPMTAPTDAFNSGVARLDPGATLEASWGIELG